MPWMQDANRRGAVGLRSFDAGIEFPEEFSGSGIERENLLSGSDAVENAVDDEGSGLQAAFFARVEGPGDFELADVGAIDLSERGEVIGFGGAGITRPVLRSGREFWRLRGLLGGGNR